MEFVQTIAVLLVGAAFGYLGSVLLDRRRETALQTREHRQAVLDLRVAARLLRDELLAAMAVMEEALESGVWGTAPASTDQWRQHGPVVSRGLSFHQWVTMTIAYGDVLGFNRDVERHGGTKLVEGQRWAIEHRLENIEMAEQLMIHAANDAEEAEAIRARVMAEIEKSTEAE